MKRQQKNALARIAKDNRVRAGMLAAAAIGGAVTAAALAGGGTASATHPDDYWGHYTPYRGDAHGWEDGGRKAASAGLELRAYD